MQTLKLNLIAAWLGILLGFGSGLGWVCSLIARIGWADIIV